MLQGFTYCLYSQQVESIGQKQREKTPATRLKYRQPSGPYVCTYLSFPPSLKLLENERLTEKKDSPSYVISTALEHIPYLLSLPFKFISRPSASEGVTCSSSSS